LPGLAAKPPPVRVSEAGHQLLTAIDVPARFSTGGNSKNR
jgi:hypothetical protein